MDKIKKGLFVVILLGLTGLIVLSTACVSKERLSPISSFETPASPTSPTLISKHSATVETPDMVTPALTVTPTVQLTLSNESRQELILNLLKTNGGCSFPCWWGITPGKTTWTEAKTLLESKGFVFGSSSIHNGMNTYGIIGGLDMYDGTVSIDDSFGEIKGTVEAILLRAGGFDEDRFRSVFINYSVQNTISVFGKPSRIFLQSHAPLNTQKSIGYVLWLFYDHLGFLLKYSGTTAYEKIYHVCPKFENGGNINIIDIYLTRPNKPTLLENIAGYSDYQNGYIYPLDELGFSIDSFYTSFSKNNSACFDVPSDKYNKP